MERFVGWWKKENRYKLLVKAVLMGLLPLLCCVVACAAQGKAIWDVYLPNSEWNDELFYFKQVEGIVHLGYPQGYFGFNESHALRLSFAAWSPVLVFPWILWGLLFGWNLMSPILCNVVLMTAAMVLFVCLVKPSWKQLGVLTLLFCLYTHFVRYMLSGMPEIICMSLLIIFYGLALNYLNRERIYKLVLLFVLSGVLTLMRPYMLLFMLLPVYLWVRRSGLKGLFGSLFVLAAVGGSYALIKHYLGAEYFTPLFFTDWITAFFERGFFGGLRYFFSKLYWMGTDFLRYTIQGFRSGMAAGTAFGGYLLMMAVLLWQTGADFLKQRREKKEKEPVFIIEAHLALCFVGMQFALLLMYKLTEGSKHLLTFIGVGIFVVSLMRTRFYKKAALLGAAFAFFYTYMAVEPYDYQIPYVTEERQVQIETWRQELAKQVQLEREETPSFENVAIWLLYDNTQEGTVGDTWQILYALPEGMGISCCYPEYVTENFQSLKSRYIAAIPGGEVARLCEEAGYALLYSDQDMAFYDRMQQGAYF